MLTDPITYIYATMRLKSIRLSKSTLNRLLGPQNTPSAPSALPMAEDSDSQATTLQCISSVQAHEVYIPFVLPKSKYAGSILLGRVAG